ncbi:helix-turn-helix transcriptional regulator [Nonomuraea sp. NPDC049695]|uniref:helix-turn-helix domain-containing protein n=1 Tax=Nonomuraea sp. NPDC049695 TaxID=3154734 RepID=UPI0034192AEE
MEDEEPVHGIEIALGDLLADRGITLTELSLRVGITLANLSILKNGRAKAIRFTTLSRLCEELDCQPGELLRYSNSRNSGAEEKTRKEPDAPR